MTLAIPHPAALSSVEDIETRCAEIVVWAMNHDNIPEIRDANNRLAAIDEYLARTMKEGRAFVAGAMRRLEVRIGQLLEPRENRGPATRHRDDGLHRQQESDFRFMAEHADIVEDVIAHSDDDHPASRRKVTNQIRTRDRTLVNDPPGTILDEFLKMLSNVIELHPNVPYDALNDSDRERGSKVLLELVDELTTVVLTSIKGEEHQ